MTMTNIKTTCFVTASEKLDAGIHDYEDGSRIAFVNLAPGLTILDSDITTSVLAEKLEDAAAALRRLELDLDGNAVAVPHDALEVA